MSFEDIFRNLSAEQGWHEDTEVNVLLQVFARLVRDGKTTTEELEKIALEHSAVENGEEDGDEDGE